MATAAATGPSYEIAECDEAGNVATTYVSVGGERVDVIQPQARRPYTQQLLSVFLPAGFPHSVTEDYIQYQIYVRDGLRGSLVGWLAGLLACLLLRAVV